MKYLLSCLLLLCLPLPAAASLYVLVIQGLGGMPDYEEYFSQQTERLERAVLSTTDPEKLKILRGEEAVMENIRDTFSSLVQSTGAEDRIAVFLVGHGSYDGYEYKFNIPGPDLSAADLAGMMNGLSSNNQLLVNTGSCSGAALETLKAPSRIVITATRSGNERNATRFGSYFTAALSEPEADTNKNDSISVKEAFEYAERGVADSFEREGILATEHPQIAGERLGEYQLARLEALQPTADNSRLAELMRQRDELDSRILELQLNRESMSSDDYFSRLQQLMIEMAIIDGEIESARGDSNNAP